jgi:hypothetical protein
MPSSWEELKRCLLERGTKLGEPATEGQINSLQSALGVDLSTEFRAMCLHWNGFSDESEDDLSMISIWSINRIYNWSLSNRERDLIPIADFFLSSELIVLRTTPGMENVSWNDRGRIIANGVFEFCEKLTRGDLDIISPGTI